MDELIMSLPLILATGLGIPITLFLLLSAVLLGNVALWFATLYSGCAIWLLLQDNPDGALIAAVAVVLLVVVEVRYGEWRLSL